MLCAARLSNGDPTELIGGPERENLFPVDNSAFGQSLAGYAVCCLCLLNFFVPLLVTLRLRLPNAFLLIFSLSVSIHFDARFLRPDLADVSLVAPGRNGHDAE